MTAEKIIELLTELSASLANEQSFAGSESDHSKTRELEAYYDGRESAFEDAIDYVNALIARIKETL